MQFPRSSSWDLSSSHVGEEKLDTDSWFFTGDLAFGNPGTGIWGPFPQLPASSIAVVLTSLGLALVQLAWERQETESVHFSKPGALDLMFFCISINLFQWSKPCCSAARKEWKIVLDAFLVLQLTTVNYHSSKKLESKQRPHDSNSLLHYSFLGHAE